MTRRTPQPGDSYTKGDVTWFVESVTFNTVTTTVHVRVSWASGPVPMDLSHFHDSIAIATWGATVDV